MPKAKVEFAPAKISSIKSVAVISFTVPAIVGEQRGTLSGLNALIDIAKDVISNKENLGNGQEAANEAVSGFIEVISASGRWDALSARKVSANIEIKSLTASTEKISKRISMDGTPAVTLNIDGEPGKYAASAAKALGVDGVMMLVADNLSYFLRESIGVMDTGTAKVKARGVFKLYDKHGNSVWESEIAARSDETGAMVSGAVNPLDASKLNKSLGRALATMC